MKGKKEGDHKMKSNEENDNYFSLLRSTFQAKASIEPDGSHNNDIKNGNKDGDIMNDNEEGHSTDNPKSIEDRFRHNNVEKTLTQLLKNKDMLSDEKNKRLENREKLLKKQSELLKSRDKLLKRHDDLLKVKNKLIESRDAMIQSIDRLSQDNEEFLENGIGEGDAVEEVVARRSTLKEGKTKHVNNAEIASEVNTIELLEKKINILEVGLKTVLDINNERRDKEGKATESAA